MDVTSWGVLSAIVLSVVAGAVIIVVVWQVFATRRAKAAVLTEDAYRRLAERSLATHAEVREDLVRLGEGMVDLQKRMGAIEKVMSEID